MIAKNELDFKKDFFNTLFELKGVKLKNPVSNQYVKTSIVVKDKLLNSHIQSLVNKYKNLASPEAIKHECMILAWQAIRDFFIRDGSTWEAVIEGNDIVNRRRLLKSIMTRMEHGIYQHCNPDLKRTSLTVGGNKQSIHQVINFLSIDVEVNGFEEDDMELLIDTITESFFAEKDGYVNNHFVQWFLENKEKILTKKQLQLLNNLTKCMHLPDGYTDNDCQKVTGVPSYRLQPYLERICDRVLRAYNKEFPNGKGKSFRQMEIERKLSLLNELMALINSEEVRGMNKRVSDWIVAHIEEEWIQDVVYDACANQEETKAVVAAIGDREKKVIPNKVLYKVCSKLEDMTKRLHSELEKINKPKAKLVTNLDDLRRRKENKERQRKYKEFITPQPCYVYQKNDAGELEFIGVQLPTTQKQRKTKLMELTPFGTLIPQGIDALDEEGDA